MTTSTPPRHTKKRLMKTVGAHTPCSCGYIQGGELYFSSRTIRAMCAWCSIKLTDPWRLTATGHVVKAGKPQNQVLEFNNFARKLLGLPKRNPDKEHNKKI